jgi:hypothetical protein
MHISVALDDGLLSSAVKVLSDSAHRETGEQGKKRYPPQLQLRTRVT